MLCPSIRPSRPDAKVLGLYVDGRVRFLGELEPLTDAHHEAVAPALVEETFRLAGRCYHCREHWDAEGQKCRLAPRIAELAPTTKGTEDAVASCPIRFDGLGGCRHFAQEGIAVCRHCAGYAYADTVVVSDNLLHIAEKEQTWI